MRRASRVAATAMALLGGLGALRDARAKAHSSPQGIVTIEGVISAVEASDNWQDADLNFIMRPLEPGEPSAFPQMTTYPFLDAFWSLDWITGTKTPQVDGACDSGGPAAYIPAMKGKWSDECQKCAGTELDTCRPDPDRFSSPAACRKVMTCGACLWDMSRMLNGGDAEDLDTLSCVTAKAELFVAGAGASTTNWNDFNENLNSLAHGLGMGRSLEDEGLHCAEYKWDGAHWKRGVHQICGKHALLTGVVSYDNTHRYRPEIHPLSRVIVASDPARHRFKVGAFIDGSWDYGAVHAYNYRHQFGRKWMPETVLFPIDKLLRPQPPAQGGAFYFPSCSLHETTRFDVLSPTPAGACAAQSVRLDFDKDEGAAWTADIVADWKKANASLKVVSATLKTPGGILAYDPTAPALGGVVSPRPSALRAAPSSLELRGRAPVSTCVVERRADDASPARKRGQLRRWYRWEIETMASASSVDPKRVSWTWARQGVSTQLGTDPNAIKAPLGKQTFSVWIPAYAGASYLGELDGELRVKDVIQGKPSTLAVDLRIHRVHQLDDVDAYSADDFYAKAKIDGAWSSRGAAGEDFPDTRDIRPPNWLFRSEVDDHEVPIALELWDSDSTSGDDAIDINPTVGKRRLSLKYDTRTGKVTGDASGNRGEQIHVKGTGEDRAEVWFSVTHSGDEGVPARTGTVAETAKELHVPRPTVKLRTSSTKVLPGPVFSTTLDARAAGFCGPPDGWRYVWKKNGQPLSIAGAGPIAVAIKPGERVTYEVAVQDAWGVELGLDAIVLGAPEVEAKTSARCAAAPIALGGGTRGLPAGTRGDTMPRDLCPSLQITAALRDQGGIGVSWSGYAPSSLTYAWSELRYLADATTARWEPIPAAWMKQDGANLTLSPSPLEFYGFAGTVTVTDPKSGRSAVANFKETNDVSGLRGVEATLAGLWALARPGRPFPGESADVAERASADPLERPFRALSLRIARARADDEGALRELRADTNALRRYALWTLVAAVGPARRVTFATQPPRRVSEEALLEKLRREQRARLRADPLFLQAFPFLKRTRR